MYPLAEVGMILSLVLALPLAGCDSLAHIRGMDDPEHTVVLRLRESVPGTGVTDRQIEGRLDVLRSRIDGLSTEGAEITIKQLPDGARFTVVVPGVPRERLIEVLAAPGQLTLRPVMTIIEPGSQRGAGRQARARWKNADFVQSTTGDVQFQWAVLALDCKDPQESVRAADDAAQWLGACDPEGTGKYVLKPAAITGDMVVSASPSQMPEGNTWAVLIDFDRAGTEALAELSAKLARRAPPRNRLAIVLDGEVRSTLSIEDTLRKGEAQITGGFTQGKAENLASMLVSGSMGEPLEVEG